ncbi:unnamed protein product [Nyctereutes procyonoides]|uniref:(raccoon dog) hypothetical protein n=1 Tax=Nyctereutes procyonoides TaxID=34880 RepID=A0A811YZM2_NYCPR|nr:unnamed protein product [Nyctereutes procyonoides]
MWLIPGSCHCLNFPAFLFPPSIMVHSWEKPFSYTILSSFVPLIHLVPSWKIPSPPHIQLSYIPPPHPSGSFLEDKIYSHHPSFLSTPIHCSSFLEDTILSHIPFFLSPPSVAHSWKIPFPHTIHSSFLSLSAKAHSWNMSSPYYLYIWPPLIHCGTFLVDLIFPHHLPFLSIPKYYGSFLEDISLHTIIFLLSLSLIHYMVFLENTMSSTLSTLSYLLPSSVINF